jgi:hypothetical protein
MIKGDKENSDSRVGLLALPFELHGDVQALQHSAFGTVACAAQCRALRCGVAASTHSSLST